MSLKVLNAARTRSSILILLTGGNIRNRHFYLRAAHDLLPIDAIGGGNHSESARPVTITYVPGDTVETDVAGDKMILRDRASVRRFIELSGAKEGDVICFERTADRRFRVTLAT